MKKLIVAIIIFSLFSGCINPGETQGKEEIRARWGDTVTVNYVGRLDDGTVFETTYEYVARESGTYDFMKEYAPYELKIGERKVIQDFEDALIGMGEGENKTVVVPSKNAYGAWDSSKVVVANRTQVFSRKINMSTDVVRSQSGTEPYVGLSYVLEGYEWNRTVVSIDGLTAVIRMDPWSNATAHTNFGVARVTADNESLYLRLEDISNETMQTDSGPAKIIGFDDETLTVDFNHPLAGKRLHFEIVVEKIVRP